MGYFKYGNLTKFSKQRYWLIILMIIFICSFILDIYLLSRYSLSYGIDGAFYDIQVLSVLKNGYPVSNDPPLVYYLLSPFVMLTGNSFLGIKIGMALMGSLLAFPAFFLTECFTGLSKMGSRVPALLSAFLITVNINYFAMLGDFMQNLVGVLLLACFMYFAVKWLENITHWQKYGVLSVLFLGFNLLTHIYTGALAVLLFSSLLIFTILFKTYKTSQLPRLDLKILGLMSVMIAGCFIYLFITYPIMFSKFTTVASFFNLNTSANTIGAGAMMGSPMNATIFFSLPYLLGIAASLILLYHGLKEKFTLSMNKNTLLAWLYLNLGVVLGILSFMPTEYQSRFILLAFLPIALIIPLGMKYFEHTALIRYPSKKRQTTIIISLIALIFALSSFSAAAGSFGSMQPTITNDQYQELLAIKELSLNNSSNTNIVVQDFETKYWVEYVLGGNVSEGADSQKKSSNSSLYIISTNSNLTTDGSNNSTQNMNMPKIAQNHQQGNNNTGSFLLPYGPPVLPFSIDKIPSLDSQSQKTQNNLLKAQNRSINPNMTNQTPDDLNVPPDNSTHRAVPSGNQTGDLIGRTGTLTSSGTTIYSGKYFTVIKMG